MNGSPDAPPPDPLVRRLAGACLLGLSLAILLVAGPIGLASSSSTALAATVAGAALGASGLTLLLRPEGRGQGS
ncbi:MAG TPA: hypothetical protein VHM48_06335 [Candidatus Limnocylindrales bacterium]|nr:hypothetical protein [Candidatus Limnocylindrales bacterium]